MFLAYARLVQPKAINYMAQLRLTERDLSAALIGLEFERDRIVTQITNLRRMLGVSSDPGENAEPDAGKRRYTRSLAARRRMAKAQRARWAAIKKASERQAAAKSKSARPKRKVSASARRKMTLAQKAR